MPTTFSEAFARVWQLVADFRANEKYFLSPQYQEQEARRELIDKMPATRKQLAAAQSDNIRFQPLAFSFQPCSFDALGDVLYALITDEIKIVEGTAK